MNVSSYPVLGSKALHIGWNISNPGYSIALDFVLVLKKYCYFSNLLGLFDSVFVYFIQINF